MQLDLRGVVQITQAGCADTHATIRRIGQHAVCIVSDERFVQKKFGRSSSQSKASAVVMEASTGSENFKTASLSSSQTQTTAIIAGCLAGFVAILAIWLWWRRRQRQHKYLFDRSHRGSITAHSEYVDAMTPDTIAMMTHSFTRKSFPSVSHMPSTTSIELYKRMASMKGPSDSIAAPPDSPDSNADSLLHSTLLDAFRVDADSISDCTLLYEGQFTQVYKATMCSTDGSTTSAVAVRTLSIHLDFDENSVKDFMGDIALATMLRHPNIIELIGFYSYIPIDSTSSSSPATASEFMGHGDLDTLLKRSLREDPDAWKWFGSSWIPKSKGEIALDVANALVFLHSRTPSLHPARLRARDVLLTEEYTAKLCSLGINRSAGRGGDRIGQCNGWLAPEILRGEEPSGNADVYSFGVLLTALDTCSEPFSDALDCSDFDMSQQSHLTMLLCSGSIRPGLSLRCPAAVQEIAQRCLSFHAADRPSAIEVVASLRELMEVPAVSLLADDDYGNVSCQ